MKYFKTQPSRMAPRYQITYENFQNITECKQPFEQRNSTGEFSQYAICPSCLNPIQIIGLSPGSKISPYGRHTGKNINGFPKWQQKSYEYCPFADKSERIKPNENFEILDINENIRELYNLLKNQFDRVIYVISKELGMRFSGNFIKTALQQFLNNHMYCYPWLTESNLPYIFMYRGMHQQNIIGQQFLIDSPIYNALIKHVNVTFCKNNRSQNSNYLMLANKNNYLKLQLRFSSHSQHSINGKNLKETVKIYVDDMIADKTIYSAILEFDEMFFINLISKQFTSDKRQQWILNIATELMLGI